MAEHLASAVIGEIMSRMLSELIRRYGKDATTREKLQRLEWLLIKIYSAVELSEKRTIENSWLLLWRDKLKEAGSQGDDVLKIFLQQAQDADSSSSANANQHQGEAASFSAATPTTPVSALSFTRNSLFGIVQGIDSARKMLFVSIDDDLKRLNQILESLEKLSPDIGEFIRLLHLEALPEILHPTRQISSRARQMSRGRQISGPRPQGACGISRAVSKNSLSTKVHEPTKRGLFGLLPLEEKMKEKSARCIEEEKSEHFLKSKYDSACLQEEQTKVLLQGRLEAAFSEICKAVELADCHNLEDLKWLVYWGDILREAKEQDCAIIGTISPRKTVKAEDKEDLVVWGDQDIYELSSFVHRQEGLARDVVYFKKLVYLCPAC